MRGDLRNLLSIAFALSSLEPCGAMAQGRIDARWDLLSGPVDPPQTANARAIHDARRHRMVLVNGDNFGELWETTLPATGRMDWKRVPVRSAELPRGRFGFSAVYDSLRDRVILFAGDTYAGGLNDTWSLSLGDAPEWTRIDVTGELPAERGLHVAVLDPVRDRMVIFSGAVMPDYAGEQYFGDTWALELHGTPVWKHLAVTGPVPTARKSATAVYDPWNDRMVVFGGWNGSLPTTQLPSPILDDTWTLSLADNGSWSRLQIAAPLAARQEHVAVVDPVGRRMLVTGGDTWQWLRFINDTWSLPLDSSAPEWVQLPTDGDNPRVGSHTAMYSPERGSVIQFGGEGAGNEHFELDLGSLHWAAANASAPNVFPSRRMTAMLLPEVNAGQLIMTGGSYYACPSDLWQFDLGASRAWQRLPVFGVASSCLDHDMVYDPVRRRVLAFGCLWPRRFEPCQLDVWQLPLDGTHEWSRIDVPGEVPPGRQWFSLVFDSRRDRVLMFGGARLGRQTADLADDLDDLWSFSLREPGWEQIATVNSPGRRNRHGALYDPVRDRMLILAGARSGYRTFSTIHDAWALSIVDSTWSPLPDMPHVFGDFRGSETSAVLDPLRDRVLISDGYTKAWSLSLARPTEWSPLALQGESPTPRLWYGLAFDTAGDRLLLYGGYDGSEKGDLWSLGFSRSVGLALLRKGFTNPAGHPRRRLEVAILADAGFSPDTVDVASVTLSGARPLSPSADKPRPVGARFTGYRPIPDSPARRDVNGDGRTDLVLAFASDDLVAPPSDEPTILRGRTPTFEVMGRLSLQSPPIRSASATNVASNAIALEAAMPVAEGLRMRYRLPQEGSARLEVFDLAGRRVLSRDIDDRFEREGELWLDAPSLRAGVYIVRLAQLGRSATARAILLR